MLNNVDHKALYASASRKNTHSEGERDLKYGKEPVDTTLGRVFITKKNCGQVTNEWRNLPAEFARLRNL